MIRRAENPQRRNGWVMMTVLVFFVIVSTLSILLLKVVSQNRNLHTLALQREQARRIVDAGIQRGLHQLERNQAYTGETWSPTPDDDPRSKATVQIAVTTKPADKQVEISVQVRYPAESKTAGLITERVSLRFP